MRTLIAITPRHGAVDASPRWDPCHCAAQLLAAAILAPLDPCKPLPSMATGEWKDGLLGEAIQLHSPESRGDASVLMQVRKL